MISVENLRPSGWLFIPFAIVLLELSGCAVGPKYHPPAVETPAAYKEVGGWKPAQPNDQNLGGTWWTIFQDPQLQGIKLRILKDRPPRAAKIVVSGLSGLPASYLFVSGGRSQCRSVVL